MSDQDALRSVEAINVSISKQQVRGEIAHLILANTKKKKLVGATLPGDSFPFESLLTGLAAVTGREVQFDCAEKSEAVVARAMKKLPSNCRIANTTFEGLMTLPFIYGTYRVGTVTAGGAQNEVIKTYDFLWPDYCGAPVGRLMNEVANMIAHNLLPGGVIFVTVCLKARSARFYPRRLRSCCGKDVGAWSEAITQELRDRLKKYRLSRGGIRCIYSVCYRGGVQGNGQGLRLRQAARQAQQADPIWKE